MSKPEVVIAIYRPQSRKVSELELLVKKHYWPLKEFGLVTNREPFITRSSDESFLEVFEWISSEAANKAHDHPAVAKVWEAMAMVCDFGVLEQLPVNSRLFTNLDTSSIRVRRFDGADTWKFLA